MDVSVVVVSYNTRELTLACLRSIGASAGSVAHETIVVDNASADDSGAAIARDYPEVRLITSQENLGFARACNLAAQEARGRYLLLLNPDARLLEDTLREVVAHADAHPDATIVGGRTLREDGTLNPGSCWGRPTPWSLFCHGSGLASAFRRNRWLDPESLGPWERDSVREVDIVSGCFLLTQRAHWNALGGFDESFFMYGEDADLCLRSGAAGGRCVITPKAELVHHGGASEQVRADKMVRLFRAKSQLHHKHWGPLAARFGDVMLGLWAGSRALAHGCVALVSPARRESFRTWRSIWRRRAAWKRPPQQRRGPTEDALGEA